MFKLIQLLTYFTIQRRKKEPEITTGEILTDWLGQSTNEKLHLRHYSGSLSNSINDLVMPFVETYTYSDKHNIELFGLKTAQEIKKEILFIINEYWLPF